MLTFAAISVAFLAMACAAPVPDDDATIMVIPSGQHQRGIMLDAMNKASAVEKCVTTHKDSEGAGVKVSDCVLGVFDKEVTTAKAKFTEFLKGKTGIDLDNFFGNASPEVKGFIEKARSEVADYVPKIKEIAGNVITKVTGWVKSIFG